jgi:hypothetical protein
MSQAQLNSAIAMVIIIDYLRDLYISLLILIISSDLSADWVFNQTNEYFCDTTAGALPNLDFLMIQL